MVFDEECEVLDEFGDCYFCDCFDFCEMLYYWEPLDADSDEPTP